MVRTSYFLSVEMILQELYDKVGLSCENAQLLSMHFIYVFVVMPCECIRPFCSEY